MDSESGKHFGGIAIFRATIYPFQLLMDKKGLQVTDPFLPPIQEYVEYLKGIWDRNCLTNQGPLVRDFEKKIKEYHHLNVPVHCIANGGLGLQIILKSLGVKGEVITTPFSYVATASCPLWEGCKIKFADIEADSLTIDPLAVEASITSDTEAILGTHVFGNPCDCEALENIARRHGIALVYDAAHAFGVKYKGKSILEYGDASMVSMHATKLLHSVEGGFIVTKDSVVGEKVEWMRRFGHKGHENFHGVGINAKMSEFHAAMGLCNIKYLKGIQEKRKRISESYDEQLGPLQATLDKLVSTIDYREGTTRNYSYYPVLCDSEQHLLRALNKFHEAKVYPRRYFYPNLAEVFDGKSSKPCRISSCIARRILCMPLSTYIRENQVTSLVNMLLG